MREFVSGGLYFMVWYADEGRRYLVPDSLVFIGRNLFPDDYPDDRWFFQDSDSYCTTGRLLDRMSVEERDSGESHGRLVSLRENDLDQIVDLQGLIEELRECEARRVERGAQP